VLAWYRRSDSSEREERLIVSVRRFLPVKPILFFGECQPSGFHAHVTISCGLALGFGRKLGAVAAFTR
jgi:hypothetical protein